MLYKVFLSSESVSEILRSDHSNESYCDSHFLWHDLSWCTWCFLLFSLLVKYCSITIRKKATEQYFLLARSIMLYKMVLGLLTSKSLGEFQIKAIELYFLFFKVFQFYKAQFEATIVQGIFSRLNLVFE